MKGCLSGLAAFVLLVALGWLADVAAAALHWYHP